MPRPVLEGLHLLEELYEGARSRVYRARRDLDGEPVVIKVQRAEYPDLEDAQAYRREFELGQRLGARGLLRYRSLPVVGNRLALVMEDVGAVALAGCIPAEGLELGRALGIALAIAEALEALHAAGLVHGAVSPGHVLVRQEGREAWLIDLSGAIQAGAPPSRPGTSLLYVAPEQTGRVSWGMDSRADLYALGIMLYELLAGRHPFAGESGVELVHCHLARIPQPLGQLRPDLPRVIPQIVHRLVAKSPDARYQTAAGLKEELRWCLDALEQGRPVPEFEPGALDAAALLRIPERLYGREREIESLALALGEVQARRRVMCAVEGDAGTGKTALVETLRGPVRQRGGGFFKGKFDQLQLATPYGAIKVAFEQLVHMLLTRSEDEVGAWRDELVAALGGTGAAIVEVVPEMELLLGRQAPTPELPALERQNRLHYAFQQLLGAFARRGIPLVLFLDDLQWADPASLRLLEFLLTSPRGEGLLFVCTYRPDTARPSHSLEQFFATVSGQGTQVMTLRLESLSAEQLTLLVAETFRVTPLEARPMASLLHRKTGGNPFFVRQFLRELHGEGLISFDRRSARWVWEMEQLELRRMTDNVLELMSMKLRRLSAETQQVLMLAAAIGNHFTRQLLAVAAEAPAEQLDQALQAAVEEGVLLPGPAGPEAEWSSSENGSPQHGFVHDRVQQAAYELVPEEARPALHRRIGLHLLAQGAGALEERLFDIVHHLNLGRALLTRAEDRRQLVELNLAAGRKARSATAYQAGADYLDTALELLGAGDESPDGRLVYDCCQVAAECNYLSGRFERAEALFERALAVAPGRIEAARVYCVRITLYANMGRFSDGLTLGLAALGLMGSHLPEQPSPAEIGAAIGAEHQLRAGRPIDSLHTLPRMTDPERLAVMELLSRLLPCAFLARKTDLWSLMVLRMVCMSLEHGNAPSSGEAYSSYGIILGAALGDHGSGLAFGLLAVSVDASFEERTHTPVVYFVLGSFLSHWRQPYARRLDYLRYAYEVGLMNGNFVYCAYVLHVLVETRRFASEPLGTLYDYCVSAQAFCSQVNMKDVADGVELVLRFVRTLRGETEAVTLLGGGAPQEESLVEREQYYIVNLSLLCLSGRFREAWELSQGTGAVIQSTQGTSESVSLTFYTALATLGHHAEAPRPELLASGDVHLARLRGWAEGCPENFTHMVELLEAERSRGLGQVQEALHHYERAIAAASKPGFLQEEALAAERAAGLCASLGLDMAAVSYAARARYVYARWGATRKARDVEERFPLARRAWNGASTPQPEESLDLTSVLKASQALSGELVFERLLERLMRVVLESAGAERGVLLVEQGGELIVRARATVSDDSLRLSSEKGEVAGPPDHPVRLIHYVRRTQAPLVLADAAASDFQQDPYFASHPCRSILCLPLLRHGRLMALLYLENNLAAGAFTERRLEMLQLLSTQLAISLENARLYTSLDETNHRLEEANQTLEARVAQRTQDLREKNEELATTLVRLRDTQRLLVEQERLASLGAMTAAIAHEVKNPLNFIKNFSDLVRDLAGGLPAQAEAVSRSPSPEDLDDLNDTAVQVKQLVEKIGEHSLRLDRIINTMSRHSSAQRAVRKPVELNRLLAEHVVLAHETFKTKASVPDIRLETHYDEAVGEVRVAEEELGRAIVNLLLNACQAVAERFRRQPEIPPRVRVSSHLLGDRVEVRVQDNGPGIPEEHRGRIYTPFFTTKPPGEGTGLGLSISYDIVTQLHGGRLSFETQTGHGTEFIISLPRG